MQVCLIDVLTIVAQGSNSTFFTACKDTCLIGADNSTAEYLIEINFHTYGAHFNGKCAHADCGVVIVIKSECGDSVNTGVSRSTEVNHIFINYSGEFGNYVKDFICRFYIIFKSTNFICY